VDPGRDGEQARVQGIVDAQIGQPHPFALADERRTAVAPAVSAPSPVPGEDLMDVSVDGIAETVATEKADLIHEQRPAIRALGPATLSSMIKEIFEALADGEYRLSALASKYGLSKATLSRFAGVRWDGNRRMMLAAMPDLWRNTAKVLGSDADFVEAAKRAGVWREVEAAAGGGMRV
jgi:hypothetical protein